MVGVPQPAGKKYRQHTVDTHDFAKSDELTMRTKYEH
jgi:hypothetical protein